VRPAPLYRDTVALCGVLVSELETRRGFEALRAALTRRALALLADVSLAVAGHDRDAALAGADESLCVLRATLRIALGVGLLDDEAALAYAEQADRVGRQIGGWRRARGAVRS